MMANDNNGKYNNGKWRLFNLLSKKQKISAK